MAAVLFLMLATVPASAGKWKNEAVPRVMERGDAAILDAGKAIAATAMFEPYSAQIAHDHDVARQAYAAFRRRLAEDSEYTVNTVPWMDVGPDFPDHLGEKMQAQSFGSASWASQCLATLRKQSQALCQTRVPTHDQVHGSYHVPVSWYAYVYVRGPVGSGGGESLLFRYDFVIDGPANEAATAPVVEAGSPEGGSSVRDRLIELKQMLDDGLINEADYEQKKAGLLSEL